MCTHIHGKLITGTSQFFSKSIQIREGVRKKKNMKNLVLNQTHLFLPFLDPKIEVFTTLRDPCLVKDQTFYVFFFRTPSLMMRITLGRSIGGLNCDIGGFRDTNVRNIFKRFLHAGIVLYFLHNADQTFKLHFSPSAHWGLQV